MCFCCTGTKGQVKRYVHSLFLAANQKENKAITQHSNIFFFFEWNKIFQFSKALQK